MILKPTNGAAMLHQQAHVAQVWALLFLMAIFMRWVVKTEYLVLTMWKGNVQVQLDLFKCSKPIDA